MRKRSNSRRSGIEGDVIGIERPSRRGNSVRNSRRSRRRSRIKNRPVRKFKSMEPTNNETVPVKSYNDIRRRDDKNQDITAPSPEGVADVPKLWRARNLWEFTRPTSDRKLL